ncbi:hypothetical protein [Methanohalobium sp.]|uniref:hypothetical protein n=1 Tax=Methanohalobium sp. TaxID=2837493 RepID=UPI0025CD20D3|nr:hypothetical protein [Methanohalobium sp.]
MNLKAKPIYAKEDNKLIAAKINKNRLEGDFDKYYEAMCKLLNAEKLAMKDYDEEKVIVYDKEKFSKNVV